MTRIKVCGLTNLVDARFAALSGVDMLGFVFYPKSPRYVEPLAARAIIREIQHEFSTVRCVGLFVDEPLEFVRGIVSLCGLDLVQLHGHETPAALAALEGRAFRAIRPRSATEADEALAAFGKRGAPPDLLVDTYSALKPGGTGEVGDWALAAQIARQRSILLAGGLTPRNVGGAIRQVRPWGVDVSSGVEIEPGRKSHQAIVDFVTAVRAVNRGQHASK